MLSDERGVYKLQLDNWKDREFLDLAIGTLTRQSGAHVVAVVIDSIRGMQSMGENDPKLSGVMSLINSLVCDKHKASCIYIAHHKKGAETNALNKVAGSTGITSSVRAVYSVERISEFVCKITPEKSNALGHNPKTYSSILIGDDEGGYEISIVEDSQQEDLTTATRAERFLISLFREQTRYAASEIYRLGAIDGLGASIIKKAKANLPIKLIHAKLDQPWIWECSLYKENRVPSEKEEKKDDKNPIKSIRDTSDTRFRENAEKSARDTRDTSDTRDTRESDHIPNNKSNTNKYLGTLSSENTKEIEILDSDEPPF